MLRFSLSNEQILKSLDERFENLGSSSLTPTPQYQAQFQAHVKCTEGCSDQFESCDAKCPPIKVLPNKCFDGCTDEFNSCNNKCPPPSQFQAYNKCNNKCNNQLANCNGSCPPLVYVTNECSSNCGNELNSCNNKCPPSP